MIHVSFIYYSTWGIHFLVLRVMSIDKVLDTNRVQAMMLQQLSAATNDQHRTAVRQSATNTSVHAQTCLDTSVPTQNDDSPYVGRSRLVHSCSWLSRRFSLLPPLHRRVHSIFTHTLIASLNHDRTSLSPPGAHVAQSHQVESYIDDVTRQCLTDTYIIVEEVGVSSADFGDRHAAFGERFADAAGRFQTKVAVANVRGGSVDKSLARSISARCGGEMVSIASMDAWSATLGKSQSVIQIKVPRVMSEIKSTELGRWQLPLVYYD